MNSSILSKTLEEGSQIKKLIFFNTGDVFDYYPIHISFSTNRLTIDCSCLVCSDKNSNYLQFLLELWPGLILCLENLENLSKWELDLIQRMLIYCKGSPFCCKLSFSKVVIGVGVYVKEIEKFEELNKLNHFCDSLCKIYDVEFENVNYEDLLNNRVSYFKKIIENQRNEYNNEKLKFERALKYSRIECYLDYLKK